MALQRKDSLMPFDAANAKVYSTFRRSGRRPPREIRLLQKHLAFLQLKGLGQELVGTVARRGIISPSDYHQLVQSEAFRQFF